MIDNDQHLKEGQSSAVVTGGFQHILLDDAAFGAFHDDVLVRHPADREMAAVDILSGDRMALQGDQCLALIKDADLLAGADGRGIVGRGTFDDHRTILIFGINSPQRLATASAWVDVVITVSIVEQAICHVNSPRPDCEMIVSTGQGLCTQNCHDMSLISMLNLGNNCDISQYIPNLFYFMPVNRMCKGLNGRFRNLCKSCCDEALFRLQWMLIDEGDKGQRMDYIMAIGGLVMVGIGLLGVFRPDLLWRLYSLEPRWRKENPEQPWNWPRKARRQGYAIIGFGIFFVVLSFLLVEA